MDIVKKRIYVSMLALLAALVFAVFFISTRPEEVPVVTNQPIATTSAPVTYASNDSTYSILGLTYSVAWHESCTGLGHGRKIDPIISVEYPQIQGIPKTEVQQSVNLFLENEFLTDPLMRVKATCGTEEDPQYFGETGLDVSFDIKLQSDQYLSLKYAEATGLLSDLRPTFDYRGYTIDLSDGSVLSYKDLFKADAESRATMKQLLTAGLPAQVKSNPDIDRDILDYEFYLTKNEVVFLNIFLSPAFQNIEVKIPFNKIEDLRV
ncbi:MAG: DUF3298 and DUF4163 domain-containing protein [bacterium]|nr:DUF3298 and DUF4163 domain-containing protein [bacterium]